MPEMLREVSLLLLADPELSRSEAAQLVRASRDVNILREVQAYILAYSLTGGAEGAWPPDEISRLKSGIAKAGLGEVAIEGINKEQMETAVQAMEQMEFNGIPLSRYSENGYASMLDLVINITKFYLPKADQNDKGYLNRIQSATFQIIRLLDKGVSHREIANLIRNNHESIHAGKEWGENSHGYKFLQEAIEQHPNQEQIDDKNLLDRFNKQTENRVMKLRAIATEELTRK
jgi:hypothetical protein